MKRRLSITVLVLFTLLLVMQVVQPVHTNPPVTADLQAPAEVERVLERACYDCHSNETAWPWYSSIAPASWLLSGHVEDGRKHLNFSAWGEYDAGKQAHLAEEIAEIVLVGEMPLSSYLLLHPSAKLTDADKEIIRGWSATVGRATPAQ